VTSGSGPTTPSASESSATPGRDRPQEDPEHGQPTSSGATAPAANGTAADDAGTNGTAPPGTPAAGTHKRPADAPTGKPETNPTAAGKPAAGDPTAKPTTGDPTTGDPTTGDPTAGALAADPAGDPPADPDGGAGGEPVAGRGSSAVPGTPPRGDDAGPRHGLPPLAPTPRTAAPGWAAVLLLVVVGLAAGFAAKAPCLATYPTAGGGSAIDWRNGRQYTYLCYSDTIPLYGLERLSLGDLPYKTSWLDDDGVTERYMEYPVLTGLLQYVVMRGAKAWGAVTGDEAGRSPPEVVVYFVIMAVVLAFAWLAAVLATVPLLGRRRRAGVALLAVSPLVVVHVFTNFDALAVAFAAGGLLAWSRRRPTLAGVLLGLGAAAKLYPLFFLGPLLFLGIRTGRLDGWLRATVAAAGAWLAVNAPIALLYPEGWREFFRLNATRPADHDTVYFAFRVLFGWQGFDGPLPVGESPRILNAVTLLLFALVCVAVGVVALTAPRRPRVASLLFLVVAGFLLTNKVWSPQYSLWLVPLAVLAIARWKTVLAWMAVDAAVWYPRMQYFLHFDEASTKTFVTAVLVRDVVVLALCAIVVRDIYRPDRDPVRRDGEDDPCGGEFDGAPDAPLPWLRRRSPTVPEAAPT
jgi:uncharacterized membrane protein